MVLPAFHDFRLGLKYEGHGAYLSSLTLGKS